MTDIKKIISGFGVFHSTTFPQKKDVIYHLLEQGHKPSTLVIACADIRIPPAELFSTNPGELYVITNMGGLVPKYSIDGVHGILSAIEYAVNQLEVENIIVLGHAKCNGIQMMMSDKFVTDNGLSKSMKTWLSVASEARDAVKREMPDKSTEEQQSACEHESIVISLRNLLSYPYIKDRMAKKQLKIFGWHFNIEHGSIQSFNPGTGYFESII